MKIGRVVTQGLAGVPDRAWDFEDPNTRTPHPMVAIAGPSASGKTRLLEAIVTAKELIAPYGARPRTAGWLRDPEGAAKVTITWHVDDLEAAYAASTERVVETDSLFAADDDGEEDGMVALLERYEHGHASGKIEYVPANRSIPLHGVGIGLSDFEQKALRASTDGRKYASVVRIVRTLAMGGEQATFFGRLLAMLSPSCRFEPVAELGLQPRCFWSRGVARTLAELSSSEADAVLLAATATWIGLSQSIVLIDRPELFVDPTFIPSYLEGLAAMGRQPQLILATSSQDVLTALGRGRVLRTDEVSA